MNKECKITGHKIDNVVGNLADLLDSSDRQKPGWVVSRIKTDLDVISRWRKEIGRYKLRATHPIEFSSHDDLYFVRFKSNQPVGLYLNSGKLNPDFRSAPQRLVIIFYTNGETAFLLFEPNKITP